ncbi:MAG: efflux RND transporter periplasmic adaptor subunit [Pararhizobium sp.]
MAAWKQGLACLVLIVAALALWVRFDAGAVATLKGYGIESPLIAAIAPKQAEETAKDAGAAGSGGARPASLVVTGAVRQGRLNDKLKAIGSGMAFRSVAVTPTATGTIQTIAVRSGDHVAAGQVIATLDSDAERIAADRAKLTLTDAQKKLKRYRELGHSAAVSAVEVSDMESEVAADKLALEQAQYELSKRTIRAPFAGVIGIVDINIGDYVTTTTKVVTVDDRSKILVDFQVPERFSGAIKVGAPVTASSSAFPGKTFAGHVRAIDNRIDPDSRTLRVRAELPNEQDLLRAGMSFQVTMRFPGDVYAAVDPLAVQWDSSGAYVWKIVDGKAQRVRIQVVQRNPERILVAGDLSLGDEVATAGVQVLRPGADVEVANSDDDDAGAAVVPADESAARTAPANPVAPRQTVRAKTKDAAL